MSLGRETIEARYLRVPVLAKTLRGPITSQHPGTCDQASLSVVCFLELFSTLQIRLKHPNRIVGWSMQTDQEVFDVPRSSRSGLTMASLHSSPQSDDMRLRVSRTTAHICRTITLSYA
ncbi:hypothetical protein VTO42DRAFT_8697 [Malbranchea cinnamomea]